MAVIIAPHMERCIGCLLCVLASARERGSISIQESALRITRESNHFIASIDAGASISSNVVNICPRNCLALAGESNEQK